MKVLRIIARLNVGGPARHVVLLDQGLSGYCGPLASAAVRTAERLLAGVTDCIVTISPSQRADIVERFRIAPSPRVVVVPLGLDLRPLAAGPLPTTLRDELAIPASAIV